MSVLSFLLLLCAFLIYIKQNVRRQTPLPPGPPADPIIGHLRFLPSENQENAFCEWAKTYGAVIYLRIPGRSIVVLNTVEAAIDLLEKRSSNYSDRPNLILYQMMGWVSSLAFLHYGKQFQKHRRMFQEYLNPKKCEDYRSYQVQEAHRLLRNIATTPQDHEDHLRRFAAAIVMHISYGHQVISNDDPYVKLAKDAEHSVDSCGQPGSTPVDFLPVLRYLPAWFPGTYYVYKAKEASQFVKALYDKPFDAVKKQIEEGEAKPSFLSYFLEQLEQEDNSNEDTILDIKGAAALMYSAGADTTAGTLSIFLLAMVLYPDCQAKAQKEIDSVLGLGKLPEFRDRGSLPYVDCVLKETYRWNTVAPGGIPHCSMEDDIYNGMFIPKGSLVIANARRMSTDEAVYSDPEIFKPDRFLPRPFGHGEPAPISQFGFGRRICPGRHLAEANVWIVIASILSTFTISKAVGDDGIEITPEVDFISGLTSHVKPFRCDIKPRNLAARDTILQAWENE